jgi:hypothetical protein
MLFTGKDKTLLPFLIEEGVNAGDVQMLIHTQAVTGTLADGNGLILAKSGDHRIALKGRNTKINIVFDTNCLIKIKMPEIFAVCGYGKHAFTAADLHLHWADGPIYANFVFFAVYPKALGDIFGVFGQFPTGHNISECLKIDLIQVLNHGSHLTETEK